MPWAGCRRRFPDAFALGIRRVAFGILVIALAGCGKKGPPLAPLIILPGPVSDVSARRMGDRAILRFAPPEKNTDNSTPADVARIEIYALSVTSASAAPEAGVVVREGTPIGSIDMRTSAGTAPQEKPSGPQTFAETLTAAALKTWSPPAKLGGGPAGVRPSAAPTGSTSTGSTSPTTAQGATTPAGSAASPAPGAEPEPPEPARLYAIVPVSARGRRGPAMLATAALAPAPPALAPPVTTYTEKAISLAWVADEGVAGYNVYDVGASARAETAAAEPGPPLNESLLKEPSFDDPRIEFGKTRCYGITAVELAGQLRIESAPSAPACVTPTDTFPPPAPTGVAAVAGPGVMSLIWDAVNAPDVAGYLVLRGEAPGDTLQALTPEPIKETTFRDATVTPGTRYVYAVVAVDTAKNTSAQSAKVEETAR